MIKHRHIISIILLVTILALGSVPAKAVDIDSLVYPPLNPVVLPDIEEIQFENGLRLYLLEDKTLPLIQATVRIHGGSYLEPADKIGLAEICGSLMRTGGTDKWSSDELDDLLEGIGGVAETSIDTISGSLSLSMLSSYTDLALEVMAELLRRPKFEQEKFEQLLLSARSMISRRNDRATSVGDREFDKLIYGSDSPYARHPEYATIDAISREDLKEFHARIFRPENIQMAIFGDIDTDKIKTLVKKYFGDWKKADKALPKFPEVNYEYLSEISYVDRADSSQSNVYLGHIGGRLFDEDHAHRIVMNNVLGVGFGSRLFKEVRSRAGLAYSVYGVFTANLSYPGVFYNYVSTKTHTTLKAIKMIINEIKHMQKNPVSDEELQFGKDRYLNSFVFNFDSKSKIISRMVYYDFFGLPRDFLNKQKEAVERTTAKDVLKAAQKYLKPDLMKILVVGAVDGFDEPLEKLGLGKPVEIDITIPKPSK